MAVPLPDPNAEPGLRERKKRETRQRISDLATEMFVQQGFDSVRMADIAKRADVSVKTVFNYFPTKESLVFDQADQQLADMLVAVSERPRGTSATRAYIDEIKRQWAWLTALDPDGDFEQARAMFPRFLEMIEQTTTLRAAWGDHRHRMVSALADVLADELGVTALDPEPRTTARALVSLFELSSDSLRRNVAVARSGAELQALVGADLERAARLLDSGLWSLTLLTGARRSAEQLREATTRAEEARRQVLTAIREAKRIVRSTRA
jgi:AcrR family transcriptional regulator